MKRKTKKAVKAKTVPLTEFQALALDYTNLKCKLDDANKHIEELTKSMSEAREHRRLALIARDNASTMAVVLAQECRAWRSCRKMFEATWEEVKLSMKDTNETKSLEQADEAGIDVLHEEDK